MASNALQQIESCLELMSKEHLIWVAEQLDLGDAVDWSSLKLRRMIRSTLYSSYEDLEEEEEQLAEFLEEVANTIRDSGFIQSPPGDRIAGAAEASGTRGLENSIGDLITAFRTLMVNPPRANSDFTPPPYKKELKFKGKLGDTEETSTIGSVSYTHLTLPTILLV